MAMVDLASWMTAHGETDETLAAKLGVSRVQASRLRRRRCNPSPETAKKLEDLTKIPALDLMLRPRAAA